MKIMHETHEDQAPGFIYPNNENPRPYKPAYYGNQSVLCPTNNHAKITNGEEILRAVREGR